VAKAWSDFVLRLKTFKREVSKIEGLLVFKKTVYILRDIKNTFLYGFNSPKSLELLYVDPSVITSIQAERFYKAKDAGRIIKGEWGVAKIPLKSIKKYQVICNKVISNLSWEDSGIFEIYKDISSYTLDENILRHENLSKLIDHLRSGGKFLPRKELVSKNFREDGGVIVHLDSEGELIFSGNGYHRLAIAHALNIKCMPVALGAVHENAITSGALLEIKRKSHFLMMEMQNE